MEDLIKEQIADEDPSEVLELMLDGWKGENISISDKNYIEKFENLDSISFAGCGLKSLENFPNCPNLIKLDLSGNQIKDGISHLKHLTELMQINFIGNLIEDVNEFQCFARFGSLVYLEIEGCPLAQDANARKKLFDMIGCLKIVDGFDQDGRSIVVDDEDIDFESEGSEEEEDSEEEVAPVKHTKGNDQRRGKR